MLKRIIEWSVNNKLLVLVFTALAVAAGVIAVRRTPLEALPDLSDVQVIVQTDYEGQAPQIVEDQVTYPVTTEMLKVPGAETVRGYSFFGVSFVYIIFKDGTDLYWARTRVLEQLSAIRGKLPAAAQAAAEQASNADPSLVRPSAARAKVGLATRDRWRKTTWSIALFVLAGAVVLFAGPLLDWRNRARSTT